MKTLHFSFFKKNSSNSSPSFQFQSSFTKWEQVRLSPFPLLLFFCLYLCSATLQAQWNPNAGVIPSYTDGAKIAVSSGENGEAVLDGNEQTSWYSDAPLPGGFLKRADINLIFGSEDSVRCFYSKMENCRQATDGKENTSAIVKTDSLGKTFAQFVFCESSPLLAISLKCSTKDTVAIYAIHENKDTTFIKKISSKQNYKLHRYKADLQSVTSIFLKSKKPFTIFEIGALAANPTEFVIVDFGTPKPLGWVTERHWTKAGASLNTQILVSNDSINWTAVADLNPQALLFATTHLSSTDSVRFLKIAHTLPLEDWKKVAIWEIDAYDQWGPYGTFPAAKANPHTMSELMGINGIWGWGYNQYSDELEDGQGPNHFKRLASHARNYHNMTWDITDPDHEPNYAAMAAGKGTQAKAWVNWDREYAQWQKTGLKTEVSLQFTNKAQAQSKWDLPYEAAYNYGYAFARHFGSLHGNGLVEAIEIGNEPWDYPADFYQIVLAGMASGAKAADSTMFVLPCALQAGFPDEEHEKGGNFLGARLADSTAQWLDALNSHHYSYTYNDKGTRIAVHPEHRESSMRGILNDIRFRDANLPDLPIYLTEWGWDSAGADEDCTHGECVSESAQAWYGLRAALWFARLGIDRLTWYFYANVEGGSSLYARAGVTGSKATGFKEKKSFRAFEAMIHHLGKAHFLKVVQENDDAWIYEMGDAAGHPAFLVAWRPVGAADTSFVNVVVPSPFLAKNSFFLKGDNPMGTPTDLPVYKNDSLHFPINAIPKIVMLDNPTASIGQRTTSKAIYWHLQELSNNDLVHITYRLPQKSHVQLQIYGMNGSVIHTPTSAAYASGEHQVSWNTTQYPPGIYICALTVKAGYTGAAWQEAKKVILVR